MRRKTSGINIINKTVLILFLVFSNNLYGQNGKIQGRIYDITSNEPLPFANIIIAGTNIGTTSDLDGNFIFTGINPGFVQIIASYVGYKQTISREILVTNAKTVYIDIEMEIAETELQEIFVTTLPFQKTRESPVSLNKIYTSEIETNPGSNRDISRVIQSFPGVGSTVSFRNDIIIRGGGPSESKFYLDDIEIPNINHFGTQGASGGPVGILNADLISSVDYYSGAFPANRGNALSGIFEFTQIDGNPEKFKFRGTVGASELALTADGPVGSSSSLIMSARRSYLQFLFDAIGLPFLPTFTDYQFKLRTKINDKNELKIISIGALDQFRLNLDIENPDEEQEYILSFIPVNEQWNYAIGAVFKHFREKSYQTFVLSRNMLNNINYKYPDNDESRARILDYESQEIENKFRFENTRISEEFRFVYGVSAEYVKYQNSTFQQLFISDSLIEVDYESFLDFYKWGLFFQASKKLLKDKLTVSFGIRSDANNYSESMQNLLDQLSPRLSVSYALNKKFSVNFNTGKYFQLPAYTTLGYRDNEGVLKNKVNNLKYIGVNHIIYGVEYRLKPEIIFTIEGFHKKYNNYPFSLRDSVSLANKGGDFGVVGDEEVNSTSTGRAYGFEILNRTRLDKKLNLIAAYTFVRSQFKDRNSVYIPSTWDSKHLFTLTLIRYLKKNWSAGLKWRFVGGLPYTPYDLGKSSIKKAWDSRGRAFLDNTKFNSGRLKEFHQLDIRIDKKYFFSKWSLMLYLDIQNLYNYQADQPDYIIREQDDSGNYILINDNTEYQLKAIDSSSGTVLPTVGIMVEF
ncbi:MAG: TonB-dependent receptor [Bacteroidales bacterium]|nr:MAG: TonB-dependent receptor [Bacteroidales bacterium]